MKRTLPIALLITTAVMALAAPAANAAIYMRIDGIQGTVSATSNKGEILIDSWSLDAPSSAAGGGTGKVHYSDHGVMLSMAKASPLLNLAVANGKHIDALELTFRAPAAPARGPEHMQDYLTITLEEVMVSSYQPSAKEIGLSINYARYFVSHAPTSGTGKTMAAEVIAGLGS